MTSPTAASPPSLPSLSAKWENMKTAFHLVPFMMSELLSAPPDGGCGAALRGPRGSRLSWKCSYLQVRAEDQTPLRLYYSWKMSAWLRDWWEEKRAMFTAAPRWHFYRRVSLAWRFMSKPARDEGLMQLLEVFMSYESFWL